MKIYFHERDKTYDLTRVTETELQILVQAFQYTRPFSDIPELGIFSKKIARQLMEEQSMLVARYA